MKIRTRITLFIVASGFVASLLFSVVVFYEMVEQPFRILDTALNEEARWVLETVLEKRGEEAGDAVLYEADLQVKPGYWIEIHEAGTGEKIYQSDLARAAALSPLKGGRGRVERTIISTAPNGQERRTAFRIKDFSFPSGNKIYAVQIAHPIEKLAEEIEEVFWGVLSGLILSTLALVFIGRFVANKILEPLGRIKGLAQNISDKNLAQRIPIGTEKDELNDLALILNHMLDRLQYSFVRQRELLFDTSHELKTPLTTIRLAVETISAEEESSVSPFLSENLLRIESQILRMDRLIKDLLHLSSLEARNELELRAVEISALLLSLAEEYRPLAELQNIRLLVDIPERLVVLGDGEKLNRAFSNVIDNAIKYNVSGGQVTLGVSLVQGRVRVTVGNTGEGVPKNDVPRIFEQFFRVDRSRSLKKGGSGLGLAIVKKVVELHGGQTHFESQPGVWTSLTVSLDAVALL